MEKLERFTLGANENCGYDFDYDPVTRWNKWTCRYGQVEDVKEISFRWRLLRLFIGYVVLGLLIVPSGWIWYSPCWDYLPDRVFWARIIVIYSAGLFPLIALIQTLFRLDQPRVLSELISADGPVIMHFNVRHSLLITIMLLVWLFLAILCLVGIRSGTIPDDWLQGIL